MDVQYLLVSLLLVQLCTVMSPLWTLSIVVCAEAVAATDGQYLHVSLKVEQASGLMVALHASILNNAASGAAS